MTHTLIALGIQCVFILAVGDAVLGGVAGAWYFIGREVAQAEYRTIQRLPSRKREDMKWWGGLDPRAWDKKALWCDVILPTVAVGAVAVVHLKVSA
jgi:hypothetical protein